MSADEHHATVVDDASVPPLARVLVADDDEHLCLVLGEFLRGHGCEVVEVGDGDRALARIAAEQFDVCFLGGRMPGLDGTDVVRAVLRGAGRQGAGRERPHLVVLSSRSRRIDVERALEAGADDYLATPLDLDELERRVPGLPTFGEDGGGAGPDPRVHGAGAA